MSVISGASCSAVIALINYKLSGNAPDTGWLALLFALLIIVYYIFSACADYVLTTLSQQELYDLRVRFARHILSLPLKKTEEIGSSTFFASFTNDIENVVKTLRQLPTLFISGSMIIGASVYMFWLSGKLFAASAALLCIGLTGYMLLLNSSLLQPYWIRLREGWDDLCGHFNSLTGGIKELLLHRRRRETFLQQCIDKTCTDLREDAIRGKAIQNLFFRLGDVLYLIALGLILFWVGPFLHIDNKILTGYIVAGLFVVSPLASIINFGPNFGEASIALAKLRQLGLTFDGGGLPPEEGSMSTNVQADCAELIRLNNMEYHYPELTEDEAFTLGPIDLSIRQGETVFIIGGNGSGKTTLIKLLCGLYTPGAGRIFWQGEEVTDLNREAYRQLFSVVFAEFHLFDTLFGLEDVNLDQRAWEFIGKLQLDKKVKITNGKLSTIDLSHGQRKRLTLLVAYLEDRPVYIFDEWAADQDPLFKNVFYREILPELKAKGKTLLVITHDDRWYDQACRIIKLQDGLIVGNVRGKATQF